MSAADAYDVFQASVVAAPYVNYKREAFLNASAAVAMSLDLVSKDMRLITDLASQLGVALPTATAVAAEVRASCADGFGSHDMAALSRSLVNGLRVAVFRPTRQARLPNRYFEPLVNTVSPM